MFLLLFLSQFSFIFYTFLLHFYTFFQNTELSKYVKKNQRKIIKQIKHLAEKCVYQTGGTTFILNTCTMYVRIKAK